MTTTEDPAARGAALLDERLPGWRETINPERLELRWCSTCILGQLFGDYSRGITALGLTDAQARHYGFYIVDGRKPRLWVRLTAAWLRVLAS